MKSLAAEVSKYSAIAVSNSMECRNALSEVLHMIGFSHVHAISNQAFQRIFANQSYVLWCVEELDEQFGELLDTDDKVLTGFTQPPQRGTYNYVNWQMTIREKILKLFETPSAHVQALTEMNRILAANTIQISNAHLGQLCVLGASAGGPQAVSEFLRTFKYSDRVAFLLVQHGDYNLHLALSKHVMQDSTLRVVMVTSTMQEPIKPGCLYVVSDRHRLDINDNGYLLVSPMGWSGKFKPNISEVIISAAPIYREKLTVMIFSGMLNDGQDGILRTKGFGGRVWAQTAGSSVATSQPDSARETGQVSFNGTPEQLARYYELYLASK